MLPLILLLPLAAPPSPSSDLITDGLEETLLIAPSSALRLAIAERDVASAHCERILSSFRRFFEACGTCVLGPQALVDFDAGAVGCFATYEAEDEYRRSLNLPQRDPKNIAGCCDIGAEHGWVTINTVPESEVYADGKLLGTTPLARQKFAVGEKEFVFRDPKSAVVGKMTLRIRCNDTAIFSFRLSSLTPLSDSLESELERAGGAAQLQPVVEESEGARLARRFRYRAEVRGFMDALLVGDLDEADAYVGRCLRDSPADSYCWRALGVIRAQQNNPKAACAAYRRYLELRPQATDAETIARYVASCPSAE